MGSICQAAVVCLRQCAWQSDDVLNLPVCCDDRLQMLQVSQLQLQYLQYKLEQKLQAEQVRGTSRLPWTNTACRDSADLGCDGLLRAETSSCTFHGSHSRAAAAAAAAAGAVYDAAGAAVVPCQTSNKVWHKPCCRFLRMMRWHLQLASAAW